MRTGLIAFVAALSLAGAASADIIVYDITLTGSQEVPPNASPGTGTAQVVLNTATGGVTVTGSYSGMLANVTAAHIHGLAAANANAGVIVGLTPTGGTSGSISGSGTLTAGQITGMQNGLTYVNVHSTALPGGEIRGQIVPLPLPGAFSLVSPDDFAISQPLTPTLTWTSSSNAATYTVKIADNAALTSPILTASGLAGTNYPVPGGTLVECQTYYWGVTAVNGTGSTPSSPSSFSFSTYAPADFNGDGFVTGEDFDEFVALFELGDIGADFNGDTFVTGEDFDEFVQHFVDGC